MDFECFFDDSFLVPATISTHTFAHRENIQRGLPTYRDNPEIVMLVAAPKLLLLVAMRCDAINQLISIIPALVEKYTSAIVDSPGDVFCSEFARFPEDKPTWGK